MKTLIIPNNENPKLCRYCDRCCLKKPCGYSSFDIPINRQNLKSWVISHPHTLLFLSYVNNVPIFRITPQRYKDLKEQTRVLRLRPGEKLEGTCCFFDFSNSKCSLGWDERPTLGKLFKPDAEGCHYEDGILDPDLDFQRWVQLNPLLEELIRELNLEPKVNQ